MIADSTYYKRSLLKTSGAIARSDASFGQGYVPIYYTQFGCSGRESQILNCYYNNVVVDYGYYSDSTNDDSSNDNCDHSDDAGVTCRNLTMIISSEGLFILYYR